MRHSCGNKKLGLPTDQRIALLRSLALAFFKFKEIETTDTRAKAVKRIIEKIITLAIKGDLSARRKALEILPHKEVIADVFNSLAEKCKSKTSGGYTRITKIGYRKGDSALISKIELVG